MKTDHPLLPPLFPETWAESYGQDRYGLWQGVCIEEIEVRFRWIPPREFLMGSSDYVREIPQHLVRFEQGFWLAETVCTQALWEAVMDENPSEFRGEENPVENVSWNDAQQFIEKINSLHPGLELRLPSEAEWEYACWAATTFRYWFGDEIDQASYGHKNEGAVQVKRYPRNPWGLYQMHGNVWEWCEDRWHDNYDSAPADGHPWRSGGDKELVVLRGGSWISHGVHLGSAFRNPDDYDSHHAYNSFRLARGPELKPAQPGGAGGASGQPERGTSEADPRPRRRR